MAAGLAAEGIYFLALHGVTTVLGSGSDFMQPSVIPFNIGVIACGYLAGVALARPSRSRWAKATVRVGVDDAFGIYLSQMMFITALIWLGWGKLSSVVPWPLLCAATVVIVFACCSALTSLLARTPLAVPLTGRAQVPLPKLWPRQQQASGSQPVAGPQRRSAAGPGPQLAATGLSQPEPAALAVMAYEKNGT